MPDKLKQLMQKKRLLNKYRPLPVETVKSLEEWLNVELTYASNAIEGNTLSRLETALVIEKGITVAGKSLQEHIEAINHKEALNYIRDLAAKGRQITEFDIKGIHQLILKGINDQWAGKYRESEVKIAGSLVELPTAIKVPELMANFVKWLQNQREKHPVRIASVAHFKFVSIHPFVDGNGRTARLLMNLILIQNGFPLAIIRKEDRLKYLGAIEKGQLEGKTQDFYRLIEDAVDRSFDIYFKMIGKAESQKPEKYLKISQLSQMAGVSIHTIRFYQNQGLLAPAAKTAGGFSLYNLAAGKRIAEIKRLQEDERLTLLEIKKRLGEG
jgi:Fic family protein